jgi:hypothetical protein
MHTWRAYPKRETLWLCAISPLSYCNTWCAAEESFSNPPAQNKAMAESSLFLVVMFGSTALLSLFSKHHSYWPLWLLISPIAVQTRQKIIF